MAFPYINTLLQDAIITAKKNETFQSLELRGSVYGALDMASAQTSILLPPSRLAAIKDADSQVTKIDTVVKESEGSATAFACDASGDGATARTTISWEPFVEVFSLSYGSILANKYTYEELYQIRFEQAMKNLYKRIDEYIVSVLEAGYSQGEGTSFPTYNNAFQVALDQYDLQTNRQALWANKLKADMIKNDFSGDNTWMLGDSNFMQIVSSMANQGTGTHTNLGFQFNGMLTKADNRVINNNGIYATGYAFEKGAFGLVDWIDPLFRVGKSIETDEWTSFIESRYGMRIAVKVKRQCKDNTAINSGMTMGADFQESWQLGVQIAVPTAFTSDANTFIYKYEFDEDNSTLSGSGSY